jgi:general secretion pathway protein G
MIRQNQSGSATGFHSREAGLTLIELMITITILGILASAVIPVVKFEVKREKERELRKDLWMMRDCIDAYKDVADKGGMQISVESFGYPADLQTLVDGVDVQTKKIRFMRFIPIDPMTGQKDWDFRSVQDDADASSWGGQNVFDVHSKSTETALDGTKYNTW